MQELLCLFSERAQGESVCFSITKYFYNKNHTLQYINISSVSGYIYYYQETRLCTAPRHIGCESSRIFLVQERPCSTRHASLAVLALLLVCGLTGPQRGPVSPHTIDAKLFAAKRSAGFTKVFQAEQTLGMTHSPWCVVSCRAATRPGKTPHTRRRASTAREASSR